MTEEAQCDVLAVLHPHWADAYRVATGSDEVDALRAQIRMARLTCGGLTAPAPADHG